MYNIPHMSILLLIYIGKKIEKKKKSFRFNNNNE